MHGCTGGVVFCKYILKDVWLLAHISERRRSLV
jgi:hypothetical protein